MSGKQAYKPDRSGLADVDANLFRAAHLCVSNDEVRYYINGVHIERHPEGGVLLIATDGTLMLVVHDETGWVKKPITVRLERPGLDACKPKSRPPSPDVRMIIGKDSAARIGQVYVSPAKTVIDGTYPLWRKVVPVRKWKFDAASFNAGLISQFGKVAEILGSPQRCIRLLVAGESDPALVLFPNSADAFGVLMPMRASVGAGLPSWMRPVMQPKKTKRAA